MVCETRKIADAPTMRVNPTKVRATVLHGHALVLHVETRDWNSAEQVRNLLRKAPGIIYKDQRQTTGVPTPVSDAAGDAAVFVRRIREDNSHPRGIDLWVVTDKVRKGVALNSVQVAEILVKDYLN